MALQEELKSQGDYLFKYRSYLPLVLVGITLGIQVYYTTIDIESPTLILKMSNFLQAASIFVGLFGFLIRAYTVGYTPKNTSGRNTKEGQIADELNTKGLYSITRNPLYVGNFFMWISIVMYVGVVWFLFLFILMFWVYYERIIFAEEMFLRDKFGDSYLKWANNTSIFLPKTFKYKSSFVPFNWRKIVRKEKTGLLMLFLMFFGLQMLTGYIEKGTLDVEYNLITYRLIGSAALYKLIKTLQITRLTI